MRVSFRTAGIKSYFSVYVYMHGLMVPSASK